MNRCYVWDWGGDLHPFNALRILIYLMEGERHPPCPVREIHHLYTTGDCGRFNPSCGTESSVTSFVFVPGGIWMIFSRYEVCDLT